MALRRSAQACDHRHCDFAGEFLQTRVSSSQTPTHCLFVQPLVGGIRDPYAGAPDTRRAGRRSKNCRPITRGVASGSLTTAPFLTLKPLNLRSWFTALGEPEMVALSSVSMVRIVRLAVGLNGRWGLKIPSMTRVWAAKITSHARDPANKQRSPPHGGQS